MSRAASRLRAAITLEAARVMYDEGEKQYFTAKRLAARRLLGKHGSRALRHRPQDLPSNGEIRDALLELADAREGESRLRHLFAMRVIALEAMESLEPFSPRLIGSVATGHVRRGSDIDIHVFTHDIALLEGHLRALGWLFELQPVSIRKGGEVRDYLHVQVVDLVPLELTVYPPSELRLRPRSSTSGKPIHRVKPPALRSLIEREHPAEWPRTRRPASSRSSMSWWRSTSGRKPRRRPSSSAVRESCITVHESRFAMQQPPCQPPADLSPPPEFHLR